MKTCAKCNIEKEFKAFHKRPEGYLGYNSVCKECRSAISAARYQANKEKIKAQTNEYKRLNKEKVKEQRYLYQKRKSKEIIDKRKIRRHNDIEYRLKHNLRARFKIALKNNYKGGSAIKDLGCSIQELKQYLESKFQEGMNWENYNHSTWHIDHIQPLKDFDLTNPEHVKKACHYTNLQPLWSNENYAKNRKDYK